VPPHRPAIGAASKMAHRQTKVGPTLSDLLHPPQDATHAKATFSQRQL